MTEDTSAPDPGLSVNEPRIDFDDVVGNFDTLRKAVDEVCRVFDPESSQTGEGKGSLLLYGPPGVGKRAVVEAIASELGRCCPGDDQSAPERTIDAEIKLLESPSIESRIAGESAKRLEPAFETAFESARTDSCTVLYLGELESVTP